MAGKIALMLFGLLFSGFVGYHANEARHRNEMIECKVKRVVDGNDEPASIDRGQIARPYTIVLHQPPYRTFIVPGKLGEEDSVVWLTPPE